MQVRKIAKEKTESQSELVRSKIAEARTSAPHRTKKKNIAAAGEWSVASAKAKFSEVVASATTFPQTIKRNGKAVAVIVGIDEWQRRTQRKGTLAEFFLNSPLRGSGLNLERSDIESRDLKL